MNNPTITNLISALRAETATGAITPESLGSLLQKIVDAVPDGITVQNESLPPRYHIEADAVDDELILIGDIEYLLHQGYIPYLFRYSVKRNRHKLTGSKKKVHGPNHKGWHPFFRSGKISVAHDGSVKIYGHNTGAINNSVSGTSPAILFGSFKEDWDEDTGLIKSLRVPFGRRMVECRGGHRFKFAIGFAPIQLGTTFDFSTLITNLAVFYVNVKYDMEIYEVQCHYSI